MGDESEWMSWAECARKEGGDDILHEMVKVGTVNMRANPKLPASSKIEWPRNQQVAYTREFWSNKRRQETKTSASYADRDVENLAKYKQDFEQCKKKKEQATNESAVPTRDKTVI